MPEFKFSPNCRDVVIPFLCGLQHLYSSPLLRDVSLDLVGQDINQDTRRGLEGMDCWHSTVLSAARLGCNLDYDTLQDMAEQRRTFRHIMGIGDCRNTINFNWRRIQNNVCLL